MESEAIRRITGSIRYAVMIDALRLSPLLVGAVFVTVKPAKINVGSPWVPVFVGTLCTGLFGMFVAFVAYAATNVLFEDYRMEAHVAGGEVAPGKLLELISRDLVRLRKWRRFDE